MYPLGSDKFEHEKSYPTEQRIAFYQYLFFMLEKIIWNYSGTKKKEDTYKSTYPLTK